MATLSLYHIKEATMIIIEYKSEPLYGSFTEIALSFSGLRKVYPYYFTFTTFTKGRWVGEKILDVFGREFRAHPVEEYVSRLLNIITKFLYILGCPNGLLYELSHCCSDGLGNSMAV